LILGLSFGTLLHPSYESFLGYVEYIHCYQTIPLIKSDSIGTKLTLWTELEPQHLSGTALSQIMTLAVGRRAAVEVEVSHIISSTSALHWPCHSCQWSVFRHTRHAGHKSSERDM